MKGKSLGKIVSAACLFACSFPFFAACGRAPAPGSSGSDRLPALPPSVSQTPAPDGDISHVAENRTPVYFVIGEEDEYYGSSRISETYRRLVSLYEGQGLSPEEISGLAVLDVKDDEYFQFVGAPNQHGGGGFVAYDEEIMGWLFGH